MGRKESKMSKSPAFWYTAQTTGSVSPHGLLKQNGIHTVEYYSTLKTKKEILPYATIRMNLEDFMLSEISQSWKDKYSTFVRYLM